MVFSLQIFLFIALFQTMLIVNLRVPCAYLLDGSRFYTALHICYSSMRVFQLRLSFPSDTHVSVEEELANAPRNMCKYYGKMDTINPCVTYWI